MIDHYAAFLSFCHCRGVTLSLDDLYNNLKIYEPEVKGTSSSNTNTQNVAFVSSNNTSNINGEVNTAHGVTTARTQATTVNSTTMDNFSDAVICSFFASQPNSPQLDNEDLQQIHPDDLEEMDLRWQMVMITMRAMRFLKNNGRKFSMNGTDTMGFDKSKVKCYNCHKRGHFARECRALKNQVNMTRENSRRTVPMLTPATSTLVSCDGLGGYDWSDQVEEGPTNFALMAYSFTSSNSKGNPQQDLQDKGVINSGCSRHMTWNMPYLIDYEEIDGGYVAFGGNHKRGKITGRGIENLVDHKVKAIRCDNGTEFKNREMNQFCEMKESKSSQDDGFQPSCDDGKKVDEYPRQESECKDQENEDNVNNTNNVNTAGTNRVNVIGANTNNKILFDLKMPALKDISTFNFSSDHGDDDEMADMNNLDTTIQVSPTTTTRIHKDHPIDQVIGDLHSTTQTRNMSKKLEEHGFVTNIHQRNNHKDLQNCLFVCFLSQEEPKKMDVKSAFLYGKIEEETTQALEIDSLKRRVKKLKRRKGSRTRGLKKLYKIELSARVESSEDKGLGEEDASKQGMIKVFVAQQDENVIKKEVDVAQVQGTTAATIPTILIDEATLAQALAVLKHAKPKAKAKGIVFH
nr:hypothetical protein [Tanacetum cinerariifolium]